MKLLANQNHQNRRTLETVTALIARSQIVVAAPAKSAALFPAGFDEVDVAILDWIATEGRRLGRGHLGRSFVRM